MKEEVKELLSKYKCGFDFVSEEDRNFVRCKSLEHKCEIWIHKDTLAEKAKLSQIDENKIGFSIKDGVPFFVDEKDVSICSVKFSDHCEAVYYELFFREFQVGEIVGGNVNDLMILLFFDELTQLIEQGKLSKEEVDSNLDCIKKYFVVEE